MPGFGIDAGAWKVKDTLLLCRSCRHRTSATAGTVLHRRRLPLLTWFWAAYLVATDGGINALSLGRKLGLTSRETAWTVLNRLRISVSGLNLPPLSGVVEADEMAIGGYREGRRGVRGSQQDDRARAAQRGASPTRLAVAPDRKDRRPCHQSGGLSSRAARSSPTGTASRGGSES